MSLYYGMSISGARDQTKAPFCLGTRSSSRCAHAALRITRPSCEQDGHHGHPHPSFSASVWAHTSYQDDFKYHHTTEITNTSLFFGQKTSGRPYNTDSPFPITCREMIVNSTEFTKVMTSLPPSLPPRAAYWPTNASHLPNL